LAVLAPVSGADAYAQLVAREQRLTRDVERAERLYELEAIPAKRLEDARRDLAVARAGLAAMGASPGTGYALTLCAPISGVIDQRQMAMGQRVTAGHLLFSIIDPRTVWLRYDVSAHHAAELAAASGATFQVEGNDRTYSAARVVSIGRVIDHTKRTLPVMFEVPNADQGLRVGMLAEGLLLLGAPRSGIAVPATAVRDEDGIQVAYVQIGGESFERRVLTLGPSDGVWTIVEAGVRAGERVVTEGAYQVKLSTLNTTDFSDHGHAH
jgi:RND family efflux transporter MFP subunit